MSELKTKVSPDVVNRLNINDSKYRLNGRNQNGLIRQKDLP